MHVGKEDTAFCSCKELYLRCLHKYESPDDLLSVKTRLEEVWVETLVEKQGLNFHQQFI